MTCLAWAYPEKFIRDNVIAPLLLISEVNVTLRVFQRFFYWNAILLIAQIARGTSCSETRVGSIPIAQKRQLPLEIVKCT